MAIFNQINQNPDNEDSNGSEGTAVNKPVNVSGTGAGTAAPGITTAPGKGTSSGRFVNLQNYLNANKGYKQEQGGLAGQVAGNVENKANKIQNNFQGEQQNTVTQQNQNRVQNNPNVINEAISNPQAASQNQQNVNAFQNMLKGNYQGPTELASAGSYQAQAGNIGSLAQLGQNEAGRSTLLKTLYNNPAYNQGQQKLDNLFLQSNPNQLQKLQSLKNISSGLNTNINQGLQQIQDTGKQYAQEALGAKDASQAALFSKLQQLDSGAQGQVDSAKQIAQGLQDRLSSGQTTIQDLQNLGIANRADKSTFGVNPLEYFTDTSSQATKQNVLNSDQRNQLQALSKLTGGLGGDSVQNILTQYNGAAPQQNFNANNPYQFDSSRFQDNLQQKILSLVEPQYRQTLNPNNPQDTSTLERLATTKLNSTNQFANQIAQNDPNLTDEQLASMVKQYTGVNPFDYGYKRGSSTLSGLTGSEKAFGEEYVNPLLSKKILG